MQTRGVVITLDKCVEVGAQILHVPVLETTDFLLFQRFHEAFAFCIIVGIAGLLIRDALNRYGEDWREHLVEIFEKLDSQQVPLGDFQNTKIDVGDGTNTTITCWTDLDLAYGEQRTRITGPDGSNSRAESSCGRWYSCRWQKE